MSHPLHVRYWPLAEWMPVFEIYAQVLATFVRDLTSFETRTFDVDKTNPQAVLNAADRNILAPTVGLCGEIVLQIYIPATTARHKRFADAFAMSSCTYGELHLQLRFLREALEDDLANLAILYVPPNQGQYYYAGAAVLGASVSAQFSALAFDIEEAAKCLGLGRLTACVFHLMRVMEVGVQAFGDKIGVPLLDSRNVEKNWHNILEEADKKIGALAKGDPQKQPLSELSALLGAVKIAWRNEVMHPKASYTEEEAINIMNATKAFMGKLADLLAAP